MGDEEDGGGEGVEVPAPQSTAKSREWTPVNFQRVQFAPQTDYGSQVTPAAGEKTPFLPPIRGSAARPPRGGGGAMPIEGRRRASEGQTPFRGEWRLDDERNLVLHLTPALKIMRDREAKALTSSRVPFCGPLGQAESEGASDPGMQYWKWGRRVPSRGSVTKGGAGDNFWQLVEGETVGGRTPGARLNADEMTQMSDDFGKPSAEEVARAKEARRRAKAQREQGAMQRISFDAMTQAQLCEYCVAIGLDPEVVVRRGLQPQDLRRMSDNKLRGVFCVPGLHAHAAHIRISQNAKQGVVVKRPQRSSSMSGMTPLGRKSSLGAGTPGNETPGGAPILDGGAANTPATGDKGGDQHVLSLGRNHGMQPIHNKWKNLSSKFGINSALNAKSLSSLFYEMKLEHERDPRSPRVQKAATEALELVQGILKHLTRNPADVEEYRLFELATQIVRAESRYFWMPPQMDGRNRFRRLGTEPPPPPVVKEVDLLPPEWEAMMLRIVKEVCIPPIVDEQVALLREVVREYLDIFREAFDKYRSLPTGQTLIENKVPHWWPHDEKDVMVPLQWWRFAKDAQLPKPATTLCTSCAHMRWALPELKSIEAAATRFHELTDKGSSAAQLSMGALDASLIGPQGLNRGVMDITQFAENIIRYGHMHKRRGVKGGILVQVQGKVSRLDEQTKVVMEDHIRPLIIDSNNISPFHQMFYSDRVQAMLDTHRVPNNRAFLQFAAYNFKIDKGKIVWTEIPRRPDPATMSVNEFMVLIEATDILDAKVGQKHMWAIVIEVTGMDDMIPQVHPNNKKVEISFHEFEQCLCRVAMLKFPKLQMDKALDELVQVIMFPLLNNILPYRLEWMKRPKK